MKYDTGADANTLISDASKINLSHEIKLRLFCVAVLSSMNCIEARYQVNILC